MPKIRREKRTIVANIRVTPGIKSAVEQASSQERLSVPEWLRSIFVKELQARNLLPTTYVLPEIDETDSRTEDT